MLQSRLPQGFAEADPTDSLNSSVNGSSGPGWKRPMPRVSSMLFDLELEDQEPGEDAGSPQMSSRQLLKLLQPGNQAEHQLGVAVHAAYADASDSDDMLSIDKLADSLRNKGYDVRLRTALGGGGGGECLRNLRHQFLTLIMTDAEGVRAECIIDPSFAEQWGIARATPTYARIVAALPHVYVGSRVEPLVDFLCSELAAAFRAEGATLPPWRSADAMLSKWRPRRSVDCDMLPPKAAPSPFEVAAGRPLTGGAAQRSLNQRPAKAQRLSGAGGNQPFSGRRPSPAAGFASGDIGFALQKSASNALSDAEAQEAAAADLDDLLGGGDGGDASDSSNDSEMETLGAGDWRSAERGHGIGRRSNDLHKNSSSWRASDTVPFMPSSPQQTTGGCHRLANCFSPANVVNGRALEERALASDGSDTTQGPPQPAAPAVSLLRMQGRSGSAQPQLQHVSPLAGAQPHHLRSPSAPDVVGALPRTSSPAPAKGGGAPLAHRSGGRTVKLVPPLQVLDNRVNSNNWAARLLPADVGSPARRAAAVRAQLGLPVDWTPSSARQLSFPRKQPAA